MVAEHRARGRADDEARRDQMFPVLEPAELDRLARFGRRKSYAAGERLVATGESAPGAFVILEGRVDVLQGGGLGPSQLIVTHGPGSFMGELAQLSDRPSLVDAYAKEALALDCRAFGGQAGASARIENYLGFPTGITGLALMARAYNQALKFGVGMAIPDEVTSLQGQTDADAGRFLLTLANNECVRAHTVVIATGARYRRLDVDNVASFEGSCVHYWASPLEARLCAGQEVALAGGGNSAGQAAVYLSSQVAKVWLIIRGPSLGANMSRYLVDRVAARPNVKSRF